MSLFSTAADDSRFSLDRPRLPPTRSKSQLPSTENPARNAAPGSCSESSTSTSHDFGSARLLGGGRLGQEMEPNAGKKPSPAATIR